MKKHYSNLKKVVLSALSICAIFLNTAQAQVASYSFSQTSGSYTAITGGAVVADTVFGADDDNFVTQPIGFSFFFNGNNYTTLGINSNGFVWFGTGAPSSSTYDPISNVDPALDGTATIGGVIAPLGRDQIQRGAAPLGEIRIQTIGTSPNRKCVVQFANWRGYGLGTTAIYNYQVILSETSNIVSTMYGNFVTTGVTTESNFQVGLRGASNVDFNNRVILVNWATSTKGTKADDSTTISTTIFPASGLTFNWTPPTCLSPAGITASAVTASSATISWTASSGTPLGYIWKVVAAGSGSGGTALAGGAVASPTVSVTTGNVLSPSSAYDVYVKTICSVSDSSGWGKYSFSTPCVALNLPWTEGFESMSAYGLGLLPPCWLGTGDWTSDTSSKSNYRAAHTGTKYIYTNYSANDWAYTPSFNLTAGTQYEFSFWYKTDAIKWDSLFVAAGQGQTPANMTVAIGNPIKNFSDTIYKQFLGYFSPTTSGVYNFGVHVITGFSPWYINFDDFNLKVAPNCKQPNGLSATVASTSATLNWTETGTATAWQIEYGTPGFVLGTGTKQAVSAKPYALNSLTPTTPYSYYVRAVCGAGDTSAWVGPFNFTTTCGVAALPWSEGFESMTTVGNGIAPSCWSLDGVDWTTDSLMKSHGRRANTGKKYLYTNYSADDWAFTPPFNLTAGSTYLFSFWYKADGEATWDSVYAAVGTQQLRASMTTVLGTPVKSITDSAYHKYSATFTPTTTGVYNFGTHVVASGAPWYMNFDDFNLTDVSSGYHDMTTIKVILPTLTPSCGIVSTPVKIVVKNNGSVTETNVPVSVDVTGAVTTTLSGIIPTVPAGATDTFTIGTINTAIGGNFIVIGKSVLVADADKANDSTLSKTYAYSVSPQQTNVLVSVKCYGDTSGSINMTLSGGSGLSSVWSNGKTTEDLTNLGAGSYTDTVSNFAGCISVFGPFVIAQPTSAITSSSIVTNQVSAIKGSVNLTVSGGTPPYKYKWTTNDTTEDLTNLNAGVYKVTITDANGCKAQRTDSVKLIITGIESTDAIEIYSVYPNPNTGKFFVNVESKEASALKLEVISFTGQIVKTISENKIQKHTFEIEMPEQATGVYLLKLTTGNKVITKRVIVSK